MFYRCAAGKLGFGGVQIHGGKDNVLDNNLFADCRWAVSFSPWPESHWRNFTKGPRSSPDIDTALYSQRYPAMTRLDTDLNVNWLCRNLILDCGAFLHRNQGGARPFDNLIMTNNPGFAAPAHGEFSMKKLPPDLHSVDFYLLPFQHMGLYRDEYRRRLPGEWIGKLRAED